MKKEMLLQNVEARLKENSLAYEKLDLGDGALLIACARGARIFGPFTADGQSILWMNRSFASEEEFKKLIDEKDWGIGGDRIWMAPELSFNVHDRTKFDDTYEVPYELDPGEYVLSKDIQSVSLSKTMSLAMHDKGELEKQFFLSKKIWKADNPLRYSKHTSKIKAKFYGFNQEILLRSLSHHDIPIETWMLAQVPGGGTAYIPATGTTEWVDYYEPVGDCQRIYDSHVELDLPGDRVFKVAYHASYMTGRYGYIGELENGEKYLFIRNFYNDPSANYLKEPSWGPSLRGCSTFFYDGYEGNGGYAELENALLPTDEHHTERVDTVSTWIFTGSKEEIIQVRKLLLGI